MRVGVDLLFIQPGRNRGTETYVQGLLTKLGGREDLELVLFTNKLNHRQFAELCGVRIRETAISGANRLHRILYQQAVLPGIARAEGCDLLFCPGYLAPVRGTVPTVVAILDTQYLDVPTSVAVGQKVAYRAIVPLGARKSAAITTISEFSKRRIVEALKIAPEKVSVTHLASKVFFGPVLTGAQEQSFTERHALSRPYFLSVSNRYPHKNISGLIRAFVQFKETTQADVDLVFVGSTLGAEERSLGIGSRNDIRFLGYVSDAELRVAYGRARGFVLASYYEGFGLPVLEAMASGIPVACSEAASLPEVAGGAGLLFDPSSAASIGRALWILYSDRERCDRLVREGYRNVARFSWDRCADETHAVFRKVVKR